MVYWCLYRNWTSRLNSQNIRDSVRRSNISRHCLYKICIECLLLIKHCTIIYIGVSLLVSCRRLWYSFSLLSIVFWYVKFFFIIIFIFLIYTRTIVRDKREYRRNMRWKMIKRRACSWLSLLYRKKVICFCHFNHYNNHD